MSGISLAKQRSVIIPRTCPCPNGYTGNFCEKFVGSCSPNPCLNGGKCNHVSNRYARAPFYDSSSHHYYCSCPPNYSGYFCQNKIEGCKVNPCRNGGICYENINGQPTCKCPGQFTGNNCETFIGECGKNPCLNGGSCVFTNSTYEAFYCVCRESYTGRNCEYPFNNNVCQVTTCQNGGSCYLNEHHQPQCFCQEGFTGNNCEYRINCLHGDTNPNQCQLWSYQGFCNYKYMFNSVPLPIYCPISCGLCKGRCFDSQKQCSYWASLGLCNVLNSQNNQLCKKSCGSCGVIPGMAHNSTHELSSIEMKDVPNLSKLITESETIELNKTSSDEAEN